MVTGSGTLVVASVWLPKLSAVGVSVTPGATPTPCNVSVWGEPAAESEMASVAERRSTTVGAKLTPMAQLTPTASVGGQLFVSTKSEASAPLSCTPVMAAASGPALVRMAVCAADVVPSGWLANVIPATLRFSTVAGTETEMVEEVPEMAVSATSVTTSDCAPAVPKVTVNEPTPPETEPLAGRIAAGSMLVNCTVPENPVAVLPYASTAVTVP